MSAAENGADAVSLREAAWDEPAGAALRDAQQAEIALLYGFAGSEPGVKPSAADIAVFLLALTGAGQAIGCGGLRPLDAVTAEIKRMFVAPEFRGRGIARQILIELENRAAHRGWRTLRLETGRLQVAAMQLYRANGYRPIEPFGHYAGSPLSRCYQKELEP